MAERRMFAKTIIDSDMFLDMPLSTQALYFHLSMRADDEGFVNNPRKIQRMIGASDDDLKVLISKRFILTFESGVIVIKHWRMHNYIQKDRFKPTLYQEEKAMLKVNENNAYTECIQDVYKTDTQVSIGKDSIELGKDSIDKEKSKKESTPTEFDMLIENYTAYEPLKTALIEFIKMRKLVKHPLTTHAFELVLSKLNNLSGGEEMVKTDILNQSIINGWQGVFALKDENTGNKKQTYKQKGTNIVSEYDELMEYADLMDKGEL